MRTLNRREVLQHLGLGAAALALPRALRASDAAPRPPNILYIMADDHAANAISCYGRRLAPVFQTPNIDRIAKEGVRLDRCFCTNSICVPSRATILTGQYSHRNGVLTLAYDLDQNKHPSLARQLQQAGYTTAVYGKWHLGTEPQGFDDYKVLPGQGRYVNPEFQEKGRPFNRTSMVTHQGYVSDLITDFSLAWLKQRDTTKPFFLMCHHKAPHGPWEFHPRHAKLLADVQVPEPPSLFEDKSHRSIATRDRGQGIARKDAAPEQVRESYQAYMKKYLRCVAAIDENVGRLLAYLDDEKLTENTLVIYTSDQGMFLGEHNYEDKRWIFDEALQMPFVARLPGVIPPGSVNGDIIANPDFAPTLLELAGQPAPAEMQGRSFLPNLRGKTPADWPQSLYYRYWMHLTHRDVPAHFGVRTKKHKLVFYYGLPLGARGAQATPTPPGWELYDLEKDPLEMKNVYGDPAYAATVKELKAELHRLRAVNGDTDAQHPEVVRLLNLTDAELNDYVAKSDAQAAAAATPPPPSRREARQAARDARLNGTAVPEAP